jgi:hypothetical protein
MGVMAPSDWSEGEAFAIEPRQLNIVDNISERYGRTSGLVGAFVTTVQAAAKSGTWNGSGARQHNLSSLTDYIYEHYKTAWRPNAFEAYYGALGRLSGQLKEAKSSGDDSDVAKVKNRIEILDAQIRVFEIDTPNLRDATNSSWQRQRTRSEVGRAHEPVVEFCQGPSCCRSVTTDAVFLPIWMTEQRVECAGRFGHADAHPHSCPAGAHGLVRPR